jgi:hypothetical protein
MGDAWLRHASESAPHSPGHTIQLWNVLAIEALATRVDAL